ncbi:MAG: hypothetical protein A2784_00880 [Candidatus Chisholmbacteria bacterium RIFCSPHIGHO2_01_FULL_48_12]|uniref:HIT domain-containing protein n=1 Tax=Candidatus Chisholmbacteria bacterium RIFCSPHIGHO2_01_FULL_48_12 TaxID=1797589 RepID=A0A1G1VQQ4_9BACT|nr:MAG: hypothetical protein A2784_00880 [Candidatus Chisholmbacteria bacterium RIFCSPHIGHO2_01_FULL_48_12]
MPDCIFCKIISGALPGTKVYEDEEFVAFADIHPEAPVHVLVVSREHIESVNRLKDERLAGKWLLTARAVAHKLGIGKAYQLKVCVGALAGQTVEHLHMHVLGGFSKPQS